MKILKIFGAVVGIHLFALLLIFANPGCSSTSKPPPAPVDTIAKSEPAPTVSMPSPSSSVSVPMADAGSPVMPAPINFNPDAPALAAPSGGGIRFSPTRPNTSAASALVAEPVMGVTPATTYAVKSGDSLWSIANKNHLSVSELAAANSLKVGAMLQPGQKLLIPGKAPAVAAATPAAKPADAKATDAKAAAAPAADAVKHTVKSGESLSSIAKTYGVKSTDIAMANNITDPAKIRAGMVLVIPGWKATGNKSAKTDTKSSAPNGKSAAPVADTAKPLFNVPGSTPAATDTDSPVKAAPPSDVPVVPVTDAPVPAPAPKKP